TQRLPGCRRSRSQPLAIRRRCGRISRVPSASPPAFGLAYRRSLPARQSLHDMKRAVASDFTSERVGVCKPRAVGEDADMLAQTAAVVEHIGAHLRSLGENRVEGGANRGAVGLQRAVGNETAQPAGEMNLRHHPPAGVVAPYAPSAASIAFNAASALEPS